FAYDTETGKCVRFIYGGCGGNENNFSTRQKCEGECMEQDIEASNNDDIDDSDRCLQPIQTGPCFGSFRRYAYDRNSHQCVLFTYGGCGGNDNNFNTMKDCMATCEDVNVGNPCTLPIDEGEGDLGLIRYGFENGRCIKFRYGGRRGNFNNSGTRADCEEACAKYIPAPAFWWLFRHRL
ncbi:Kunitz/Bovine pancreatic trypsin inhibitor domain protein, partial [Ancylostoma duodenale]